MPPPAEGRTSRGVGGGGGGGVGEEQAKEAVAQGTQRNTDLHGSSQASSPLKAIQAGGHASGHLGHSGGQHLDNPGGQEVSAPGRTRSGP